MEELVQPYKEDYARRGAILHYDTEELVQIGVKAIKDHVLISLREMSCFLPCCYETARRHGVMKDPRIKEALSKARVSAKVRMRTNWMKEEAPAQLQLAAYKLMSDDDEFARLGSHRQTLSESTSTVTIKVQFGDEPLQSDDVDATELAEYEEIKQIDGPDEEE